MITAKDWLIIKDALDYYSLLLEDGNGNPDCVNFLWESHKENYGDPDKTMNATTRRVHQMIKKKGIRL